VSFTLLIFATLTWRLADVMAAGSERAAVWLAGGIGLFWGIRTLLQWLYYTCRVSKPNRQEPPAWGKLRDAVQF
jgi:hypothetical protein